MKKCPHCDDISLYGDWEDTCPVCNTWLVPVDSDNDVYFDYSERDVVAGNMVSPVVEPTGNTSNGRAFSTSTQETPAFENNGTYRGRITYIHSQSRFHSRLKKIIFSIFRGEPYQFGNTSHETLFRLAEFTPGHVSGRERSFIFYGDVEGRFDIGDDVAVRAKRRGDRYIVRSFYSHSTESYVRPKPQMPAWFLLVLVLLLVYLGYLFIASGLAMRLLVNGIIILCIIWFITGSGIFRRRGRW